MKNEWKEYLIKDIGSVIGGGTPKTKVLEYWNGDIPWVSPKDLTGYTNRFISRGSRNITTLGLAKSSTKKLPKGTVLLSSRAPIGYLAIALNEICTNQGFKSIIPNNDLVDGEFLFYNLKTKVDYLKTIGTGTTFAEISGSALKEVKINLPPLPEQKAIAKILGDLDDKIELNRQMNQTLEQMAQAMFKSWFVDFDPFKENKFKNSELGEIPNEFKIKTIGDLVTYQKGFAFKSKLYQETGQIVVRVSDTTENSININSCNKIDNIIANDYKKYALKTNDVIIATVGSWPPNYSSVVGKIVRVPATAEGGLLNQNAVRLVMKIDNINHQALLYFFLKDKRFLDYIVGRAQGSANQASIRLTDIFSYPIPIIEGEKILEISQNLELYIAKQNKLLKQIEKLTQLRETLLPKLISGELRVPEALIEKE